MADRSFTVKNGLVVNTNVLWANAGQVGINNSNPDANLTVTGNANLNGNVAISGILTTVNVAASIINTGANVSMNATALFVGNSTISFFANSSQANVANTLQSTYMNTGNSISGNSTFYSWHGLANVGVTNTSVTGYMNTTGFYIGSNTSLIADILSIGNSTVNAVVNSSTVSLAGQVLVANPAFQVVGSPGTLSWNAANGYNALYYANQNFTFVAPTNMIVGLTYCVWIYQGNGGGHSITFSTANVIFDFGSAGAPVLSTTAGASDFIFMFPYAANSTYITIRAVFNKSSST